jgi:hypothetical protein
MSSARIVLATSHDERYDALEGALRALQALARWHDALLGFGAAEAFVLGRKIVG